VVLLDDDVLYLTVAAEKVFDVLLLEDEGTTYCHSEDTHLMFVGFADLADDGVGVSIGVEEGVFELSVEVL
jgi:hypothetical protein